MPGSRGGGRRRAAVGGRRWCEGRGGDGSAGAGPEGVWGASRGV